MIYLAFCGDHTCLSKRSLYVSMPSLSTSTDIIAAQEIPIIAGSFSFTLWQFFCDRFFLPGLHFALSRNTEMSPTCSLTASSVQSSAFHQSDCEFLIFTGWEAYVWPYLQASRLIYTALVPMSVGISGIRQQCQQSLSLRYQHSNQRECTMQKVDLVCFLFLGFVYLNMLNRTESAMLRS